MDKQVRQYSFVNLNNINNAIIVDNKEVVNQLIRHNYTHQLDLTINYVLIEILR